MNLGPSAPAKLDPSTTWLTVHGEQPFYTFETEDHQTRHRIGHGLPSGLRRLFTSLLDLHP